MQKTDILIYIALYEEMDHIRKYFNTSISCDRESKDLPISFFTGQIADVNDAEQIFNITIFSAGKMGNVDSASYVSSVISELKPANLIVIGIAGSVSKDLAPGDIFIPTRIVDYEANGDKKGEEKIESGFSGKYYDCNSRLVDRFQNFKHRYEQSFYEWNEKTESNFSSLITQEMLDKITALPLTLPKRARIFVGDDRSLASGSKVAKGGGVS